MHNLCQFRSLWPLSSSAWCDLSRLPSGFSFPRSGPRASAAWVPPSYSVAPHISPTPGGLSGISSAVR